MGRKTIRGGQIANDCVRQSQLHRIHLFLRGKMCLVGALFPPSILTMLERRIPDEDVAGKGEAPQGLCEHNVCTLFMDSLDRSIHIAMRTELGELVFIRPGIRPGQNLT